MSILEMLVTLIVIAVTVVAFVGVLLWTKEGRPDDRTYLK